MNRKCAVVLLVAAIVAGSSDYAESREPFFNEFMAKYVTASGNDAFIAAATTTKCNICHIPKANKKMRNAYGMELAKLLMKADVNNPKKIQDALDKVGGMKSDPAKNDSPTWAELFKSHKLP